jgi:hypothetical protein
VTLPDPHAWVFAYGSNMNLGDLRRWLAERQFSEAGLLGAESAVLAGFQLAWNYRSLHRDGGAANMKEAPGASLPGLALAVDQVTLHAIDKKEGHPGRYCRGEQPRSVELVRGGSVAAWVYQVSEPYLKPPPVWPRRAYLELIITAAREHDLPASYIADLEATPTCD